MKASQRSWARRQRTPITFKIVNSKVLAFAFSLSSEIERQLISQRTKEALARRKAGGQALGRPVGFRLKNTKLSGKEEEIRNLLKHKVSVRAIARMYGVHHVTVSGFANKYNLVQKKSISHVF